MTIYSTTKNFDTTKSEEEQKKIIEESTKEDFIKWIEKQIEYYKPILNIQFCKITIEFKKEIDYLEISCNYPYFDNKIWFNEEAFENWKKGELKKDRILHELLHIITEPFYSKSINRFVTRTEIEDERERLTDYISLIIRNLDEKPPLVFNSTNFLTKDIEPGEIL